MSLTPHRLTVAGLSLALSLACGQALAAIQYTYDELNRLTKVQYDDGRSISYSYDAAGNLLRKDSTGPVSNPDVQLEDRFEGSALNAAVWNSYGGASCGGTVVSGGRATFNGGTYADTQGKKGFAGDKIVVEAVMAGLGPRRDTHFELIDTATGDRIQLGDTSYAGYGLYAYGTGRYAFPQGSLQPTTSAFKAYRLTVEGSQVKVERGDGFDGAMFSQSFTLPNSIVGRSFYLRIGTGAPDCVYSPGTFESVKVTVASRLTEQLADNFDGTALDASKWLSAGYLFEPSYYPGNPPVGPVTLSGGVLELGNAGGFASISKQHFKGRKIVVEARVARTGGGEFPIMLVNLANIADRVLISETPYQGVGFLGGGGGRFRLTGGSGNGCTGPENIILGSPAAVGVWMEYRMTVEGNRFTMERGPTLSNITQSATGTLCTAIDPYEFFLYVRTGSAGGYFGARFDWIRVNVTP